MTDKRPESAEAAQQLQNMLRQLGQQSSAPRSVDAERQRAARLAALIDSRVAELVASRRRRRVWTASLLAAAAAAAVVVAGSVGRAPHPLSISQEPAASSLHRTQHRAPALAPAPPESSAVPSDSVRRAARAPSSVPFPSPNPSGVAEPESTLAEENRLFKRAADASRDGDTAGALAELDRLLQTHPTSPLAQTALVKKFRLLAKAGRDDEAKREAERYLAAYPAGFAVREAEALTQANQAPSPSPSPSSSPSPTLQAP